MKNIARLDPVYEIVRTELFPNEVWQLWHGDSYLHHVEYSGNSYNDCFKYAIDHNMVEFE